MNKKTFLLHEYITHAIDHPRNILDIKILYIFVTLGAVIITMILANTGIEALPVAYHCSVKARKKYMPFTTEFINRTNKQAMILARIASDNGG
jgi:uncharacterized membrane protein YccF (DUF307 family)